MKFTGKYSGNIQYMLGLILSFCIFVGWEVFLNETGENWAPQAPHSWGPRIPTISPHFELSNVEHAGVAIQRQWACRGPHKPSSWRTGHNLRRAEQLEDWECIIDVMELWMCWSKTTSLNRAGNRNTLWGCCDTSWIWLLVTFGMLR